jgi:hypothetical protein
MNAQNNEGKNEYSESESVILDLETLSMQYRNLLVQYENAVNDYINYLQEEAKSPCGSYVGSSTGINQTCYDEIWKKAGCGAGNARPIANTSWSSNKTLKELIQDTWYWATWTNYTRRMGCYGNPGNSYIILCVGTSGGLFSRQGLDAPWQYVNDNAGTNLRSICIGNDGKTIYASTIANTIWKKSSWDAPTWDTLPNTHNCCVLSLAQGQDGTFVGVGTDNVLWTNISNFQNDWTRTPSPTGEWSSAITIAPDGSLFAVGSDQRIWKKNNYKNLPSQEWQFQGYGTCCVKSITIAPDGTFIAVGTDDQLYTKASYKDLSTPWQGPWSSVNNSCCAISVAAVVNPNYNAANYNQTSSPNYNITQPPLVSVPGSTYWGATSITVNNSATLQECQASCANTPNCTGATFNATAHGQPMCWLRGGDGNIAGGLDTDYAIVPKGKQLLENIQNINQQLTNINKQIQSKTDSGQPIYTEQSRLRHLKTSGLISQFISLTEERKKIDEMIKDYQTLDEKQTQGNLTINKNYYSFVLLLFLAIIIIFVLFYFGGSSSSSNSQGQPQPNINGLNLTTNYIVVIGFLLSLLIFCIVLVLNKTGTTVSVPTSWFPTRLPELKLSKFGWN